MKRLLLIGVLGVTLAGCAQDAARVSEEVPGFSFEEKADQPVNKRTMYQEPPTMSIDENKTYTATLSTAKGDIVVELFADKVPKTVNNFVFLSREHFYDNTVFHRTIKDFMIQGVTRPEMVLVDLDTNLRMSSLRVSTAEVHWLWQILVPTPTAVSFLSCTRAYPCHPTM